MEEVEFRGEKFLVHVRYYVCEDTGEQFTTTEQNTLQFNDLYSKHRICHGIPFTDEIKGHKPLNRAKCESERAKITP